MTATGIIEPTVTAAHSEPKDFGALFERHARAVYGFCFRRTGSWATAEDLTSVVFLEAWRKRGSVDLVREPALPWLLGVANNVTRNHARSLRRHRAALARVPAPQATPDFAEAAAERLDDEERMRSMIEHLRALPPRRARGDRAVRLGGAELRGRRPRARRPGGNRALATRSRACPSTEEESA